MASQEIEALAGALARLPGLGPRSARRAVLWLVKRRETALVQLLDALAGVRETLVECRACGNVDTQDPCGICADHKRDPRQRGSSEAWTLRQPCGGPARIGCGSIRP